MLLAAMMLGMVLPANAADYVFEYNGGYLAVDNSGNIIYTTTLSPQCVWTCVSSSTNLTAATLGTTSYYLYTTDGNGTRRWLIGSTTDGADITTSTNAGTARWRADGTRLFWRNTNSYYAYYRDNTWRTSRRNNGTSYGVNAYMSGNNSGTDYRSTTYQVTVTTVTSTSNGPTINGADVLTATGNSTYTASGAAYRIGYTNYQFNNNANHYVDADGNSFTGTPANATITNTWSLTDNAYATVNSTSGVVTVTSLPEYDITLTLTVTATATGGNPAAPAGTTFTDTKEITIQGTKPSAPIISVSGNIVTLSTDAAGSTTIRYTLNGIDPTTTTGTVYSSAIDLSSSANSPVTIKAITVRNGNASEVTEQTVTLTLPAPTITINGEAKTATISSSVAGATIYYTTDGTTPTTSSSQYTGTLTGLAYMTNVKAIVVKDGWNNSPEASGIVTIPSGVSGDVVTLFDYEPHSWSYYSDPDCPIRSLNPADVKITYYGNGIVMTGNADYTASSTDFVQPGNANYVGGAKVNVGGENENTFVYYKTLERGANTDDTWTFSSGNQSSAASRCPYKPIPNPFQVRPTYGGTETTNTADWTGWRGFQCWRLKSVSGGAVYAAASGGSALTAGAVINAEDEIYFAPNTEYGMDVQFEAVWAIAYVVKASEDVTAIGDHSAVGYERNFIILNSYSSNQNVYYNFGGTTGKRITNIDRQVTVSRYLPNGVRGQNNDATYVRGAGGTNMTLQANTKFENVAFYDMSSYSITADNHYLCFGRGISKANSVNVVRGSGGGTNVNHTLRIESGSITTLHFIAQGGNVSGRVQVKAIMGSDYDRAKGDNSKLSVSASSSLWFSSGVHYTSSTNKDVKVLDLVVKSGEYQKSYWSGNNADGQYNHSLYLGANSSGSDSYPGVRYATIEGGEFASMNGGRGTSNMNNASANVVGFYARVKNGTFNGSIFGGAADNNSPGGRSIIITGGTVKGWVAGGGNGTGTGDDDAMANTVGNSYIYIGGNAIIGDPGDGVMTINETVGGQVFGAGRGKVKSNGTSQTAIVNNSYVVIADNSTITSGNNANGGNVYGGGNLGIAQTTSNVYVVGGTVQKKVFGGAFGNANTGTIPTANVTMTGGLVEGGVFGGSNSTGSVNTVTMNINGGQVGTSSVNANVHGGGLGNATRVLGSVTLNVGSRTDCVTDGSAVIYGDVYGGSAEGKTNGNTARENNSVTNVTLNKGTIYGSLYGGGLGSASYAADVYGPVAVKVYGGTLTGGVYGANNVKGAPQNSVTVDIYGTDPQPGEGFAIANVYGGGNQAAYNNTTYPTVTVHNCNNSIGNVYGGGNAAAVTNTDVTIYGGNRIGAVYAGGNGTGVDNTFQMVTGNAVAKIYGGTIDRVFAGNNSSGIVVGDKTVTINAGIDETTNAENCITCGNSPMKIGAVFHGGNQAAGSKGTVNIVCTGTYPNEYIDTLFGGANNADIVNNNMSTAEDVTLNIDRGYIRTGIFGGNNSGGAVTGDITINLTRNSGGTCAFDYPSVFGGGFGEATETGGNITINIGEKNATTTAPTINGTIAGGAVYGGSALGSVNANSSDNTLINIYNGTIAGNIYGGGLGEADNATKGKVNGAVTVNIGTSDQTDGNCASDLTACSVYGCNNTGGSPQGDVTVNVYRTGHTATNVRTYTAADATYAIDQVFGGGNQADYTPSGDNKATVHIFGCDNTIRRVFGGGNAAAAKGVVTTIDGGRFDYVFGGGNGEVTAANIGAGGTNLTVNAGLIHYLFGGSNTSGTISGPMLTTVNNLPGCDEQIDNFFGGGNLADLGEAEHPISLTTTINCGTIFGDIYGGCNLANIYGDVTLTINGGTINNVYAGSKGVAAGDATYPAGKAADINGNVSLNIHAGDIGQAFGGSNIKGNITGTVNVVLDWTQSDCSEKQIDYIYGASNDASYTPTAAAATGENFSPVVTLLHGTVNENVYGGGKGPTATVTAKPKVIAGDPSKSNNKKVSVMGDIFGGGNAAPVVGSTNVIVGHNSNVGRNVFGGGNAAPVSVDTEVEIKDKARISGNIYGGGNQGEIGRNTKVIVNGN